MFIFKWKERLELTSPPIFDIEPKLIKSQRFFIAITSFWFRISSSVKDSTMSKPLPLHFFSPQSYKEVSKFTPMPSSQTIIFKQSLFKTKFKETFLSKSSWFPWIAPFITSSFNITFMSKKFFLISYVRV